LETCRVCPLINLCLWCPAHAYLETGALDGATPYFCDVAHARTEALKKNLTKGIAQQPPLCHPLHAISQEVPGT
jgi:sulfatase maturation enzyme AslB (radical SAM superfamily)